MEEILSHRNIYTELVEIIERKQPCVLATVSSTTGSAPQVPGSSAVFGENGLLAGTVGGGKVEFNILKQATEALTTKKNGYFHFNLNDDLTDEDSSICGGSMNIFIDGEPEKHFSVFKALTESHINRIPGILVSLLKSDASGNMDLDRVWVTAENFGEVSEKLHTDVIQKMKEMLRVPKAGDFNGFVEHTSPEYEDNYVFLESVVPLPKLIIAGAGHVGKALVHMGKLLDFEVTVWDDRPEFANEENLPAADKILCGEMEEVLGEIVPGRDTFIVIVTRGHKNDSEVLRHFIRAGAGYIGMMGSRKKVLQVRDHFLKNGWATAEQWEKVYTPIGLPIHSKTVQEIAVSIAAELVQVRAQLNKTNG